MNQIPKIINTIFTDFNCDSVKLKLNTEPFINGSINDVTNWMVKNPLGNVDMKDVKTGITLFFLTCRYNKNDDLIIWLIENKETNLNFTNSNGENILEYLSKCEFNSPLISSRIILILKYHSFDTTIKNQFGDTIFDILCYSGYTDVIKYLFDNGLKIDPENIKNKINKLNEIIKGECDDYWTSDEINNDFLSSTLENVIKYLELTL